MGMFERLANAIFRTATGDEKKRWIITPFVALIFAAFITLLVIAAIFTDEWLKLPSIAYPPLTLVVAVVLLVSGIVLYIWTITNFGRAERRYRSTRLMSL